ncbi:MAG TPA: hypothetical protein VE860_08935 [Chthoniobacterales bacterium]|jgi:hypothetical protein|nr:hypothetical protein [Chthoniobacterales bacterium]
MTIIETIVRGVQNLPLREQVQVARYVHRLSTSAQQERAEVLRRTHGALDEADGQAFEQAMNDARRLEAHG